MSSFWAPILARLIAGEELTADEAGEAMRRIMRDEASPGVLAAFTHVQRGHAETAVLLRGMLGGFYVYALLVFGFAMALGASAV